MSGLISKTIDGQRYEFAQFGAKKALKIGRRLIALVGEPLVIAFSATDEKKSATKKAKSSEAKKGLFEKELDMAMVAKAIHALVDRADEDEVLELIEDLAANDGAMCDGKKIVFDLHYRGRLGHLFKVLFAAVEVQYGNFSEGNALVQSVLRKGT